MLTETENANILFILRTEVFMTVATSRMTLADFLAYDDGTDQRYELENGEMILMPAESDINQRITTFLLLVFAGMGVSSYCLRIGLEVAVSSTRVGVRLPDLAVLSEEGAEELAGATRSMVSMDMSAPLLLVEVVSKGQEKRDYRYKRSEYAARGVAEYWIVDPLATQVTILELVDGFYEEQEFKDADRLISTVFPELNLTAAQSLQAMA
jgi:Uma2 family endonuclease